MPTGYTAEIKDGITFEQFVMRCSRAMGALVMMRDDPMDAPIPERFEPSDYHAKKLAEAQKNLAWYTNMADSEAEREAEKEFNAQCEQHEKRLQDANELRNKYNAMLAQVLQWQPPSHDHEGFKEFMLKQIRDSIDFDCSTKYYTEPVSKSTADWKAEKIKDAHKDIEYHTKGQREEIERTDGRNAWLKALRDSLKAGA
jgi:hypothetical protein